MFTEGIKHLTEIERITVIFILIADGHVRTVNSIYPISKTTWIEITEKGTAFINTDGYVERLKRQSLDDTLKIQQKQLNDWNISKLRVAYNLSIGSFIIAILAIVPNEAYSKLLEWLQSLLSSG